MAPSATHSGEEGGDLVAVSGGYMRTSVNPSTGATETVFVPDTSTSGPPSFGDDKHAERAYLKHRLALAFRVFAAHGFAEGIAGHITLRDPVDPESFWVNPFGMHFSLIKDSDLIRVDAAGKVVDGGKNRRLNYAAFAIHHAIHTARPDVLCAAHAHSTHGRAFSAAGRALDMLHQDACIFHNDHVLYP
ncbi:class 2 aldolase adducin domain-containing protein [Neofusicoccum parvum]|nr:class 2 aldolase adducin domain-containing protein [Neofusicoccum parvum]